MPTNSIELGELTQEMSPVIVVGYAPVVRLSILCIHENNSAVYRRPGLVFLKKNPSYGHMEGSALWLDNLYNTHEQCDQYGH